MSVRLRSRSKKQGIKRLPESIELSLNATVEDAKKAIAKQAGVSDFNRLGLYDPTTNKTLKDRKALIKDCENVVSAGEMLVKDLGKPAPPYNRMSPSSRQTTDQATRHLHPKQARKSPGAPSS